MKCDGRSFTRECDFVIVPFPFPPEKMIFLLSGGWRHIEFIKSAVRRVLTLNCVKSLRRPVNPAAAAAIT
jgi:hypothetical protein